MNGIETYIFQKIIDLTFKNITKYLSKETKKTDFSTYIENHLKEVSNWSNSYNFLGLAKPKDIGRESIGLKINSIPRRFYSTRQNQVRMEDYDLLSDSEPLLLLGDPGSGKTTTLKRLALSLLTENPIREGKQFNFPLMILLKELPSGYFVCEKFADILGLEYSKKEIPVQEDANSENSKKNKELPWRFTDFSLRTNDYELCDALANIIDAFQILLLIDGLDELPNKRKLAIGEEIEILSRKLKVGKIILTCRSGGYQSRFEGFQVYEIAPLTLEQSTAIADIWLSDSSEFILQLEKLPYRDIIDRPILLTFLLFLYMSEGDLPEQPSAIYKRVVYRLLKDWDEERGIKRRSSYSKFGPDQKIDFLSEFAYVLTYLIQGKVFSEKNLISAYESVCSSFNLPINERKRVVEEIETHTGILIRTGFEKYEFSHLSLQEFFCGNYIHRSPYPDLLDSYFRDYPSPLAIACVLSSNPSRFFFELMKFHISSEFSKDPRKYGTSSLEIQMDSIKIFVSRLLIEFPYFKPDGKFGESIFYLFGIAYNKGDEELDDYLLQFLTLIGVRESLVIALQNETIRKSVKDANDDSVVIKLPFETFDPFVLYDSLPVRFPKTLFLELSDAAENQKSEKTRRIAKRRRRK